jgi:hypothetical protein
MHFLYKLIVNISTLLLHTRGSGIIVRVTCLYIQTSLIYNHLCSQSKVFPWIDTSKYMVKLGYTSEAHSFTIQSCLHPTSTASCLVALTGLSLYSVKNILQGLKSVFENVIYLYLFV